MRASVEFEVFGSTLDEIKEQALRSWKEFMENDEIELPHDTEIHIEPSTADDYKATVYVRTKVENDQS
jgi:hypothetical protein